LDTCSKMENVDNQDIISVETEKEVLMEWNRLINTEDPDIIIGYNIFGFDYDFIYRRTNENNITEDFLKLSRNKEEVCGKYNAHKGIYEIKESSINIASGRHDLRYIEMNGRIQVDMYNYLRRDYNLVSYKLDHVSGYFIGDNIKKIEYDENLNETKLYTKNLMGLKQGHYINFEVTSHSTDLYKEGMKFCVEAMDFKEKYFIIKGNEQPDMTKSVKWCLAKDDVSPQDIFRLTNQGAKERSIVAKYCIQDCNLVHNLFKKIDVLTGFIEMANICSVPVSFLVMRGQGIKLTSYIAKKCRIMNTLMPTIEKKSDDGGYEGAIVLDPKSNLYLDNPVACVDFASLYPSSMLSENLSHDSKVWTKEFNLEDQLINITGEKNEDNEFKYDNLEGYEYVDVVYDTFIDSRKTPKAAAIKVKSGYKMCRFAQFPDNKKGIMPTILSELLAARKATRKLIPQTDDEFMKNILDKRQLGYKVTANSLYGQCGARTSTFYEKDVAASTTATGRKLLTYAKRIIEEVYGDNICDTKYGKVHSHAEYIYGDTDSVFMSFNLTDLEGNKIVGQKALEITIELAIEAGELATKYLKKPHDLEYEKTFMPFCLLSKKRYVGMLYETDPSKCYRKSMGIVLKRRDNAPIVKDIYGGIIDILMKDKDIHKAVEFCRNCLKNIKDENYPMDKLIITKSLSANYKNPERIAHKVLAERIGKRDPGNKPNNGDRVPFVYIENENKKALQGERIEHPNYMLQNNIKPNYDFYITNQILKPVSQVFALVLEQLPEFKERKDNYLAKLIAGKESVLKRNNDILDEEKWGKKILDVRNREIKEIIFDEFLDIKVKKPRETKKTQVKDTEISTQPKKETKPRRKPLVRKPQIPKEIKEDKKDEDGIITKPKLYIEDN
jgi:DNA polymerase elongation subunit (family B)